MNKNTNECKYHGSYWFESKLNKKTITIIGEDKVVIVFYLLVAYFCL